MYIYICNICIYIILYVYIYTFMYGVPFLMIEPHVLVVKSYVLGGCLPE